MPYTLKTLADKLELAYSGNADAPLDHICAIESLDDGGVAFINNPAELSNLPTPTGVFDSRQKNISQISTEAGGAIIVPEATSHPTLNLILSDDPLQHHIKATSLLYHPPERSGSIHPDASVGKNVIIGKNVTIDARAVIYDNVTIGDQTVIRAGAVIMPGTTIGSDTLIYPNVTIRENCQVGNQVIIHAGAVVGADGFGFYQREGVNLKIPQTGIVIIKDNVEIGAGSTIDRARFHQTVIGNGCKLDNLIHVAHNVQIGDHALIAAQSGIAGSTSTGSHLMMGGQSGIRDNLKIGNNVTLFARTLITSRTSDGETVAGMPSRPIKVWRKAQALINSLDRLVERVKRLEKRE